METTYPVLTQMNIYSISRRHGCREAWLPTVPAVGGPGGAGTVSPTRPGVHSPCEAVPVSGHGGRGGSEPPSLPSAETA